MKRTSLALGIAALFASSSASAVKVPTGSTDYDLNVSVLLQARVEGNFQTSADKHLNTDFFVRRARVAAGGTAFKVFSFFVQYDNSNLGKRGNLSQTVNPGFVQDLIIGWTPIKDFTIEGGLILEPTLRTMGYSASGGQVQIDAPTDLILDSTSRGFRMPGVELRGFIGPPGLTHLVHYRAGVWQGVSSTATVNATAATATAAANPGAPSINPSGKPMVGAHVRVNLIGDETGYGLNQMYLDGKPRASIGGAVQYQPQSACAGIQTGTAPSATNCSLSRGPFGPGAAVNDYKMFGGDAFVDLPIPGDMEFAASASVVRWDYGSTALAGQTGFSRTGTGYSGEVDLRIGPIAPYVAGYQYAADSGTTTKTADRRKIAAGLCFFIKGQQDKVNLEWNNITPGTPGNPTGAAPAASNVGLFGPATNAIWIQGQAAF